MIEEKKNMTLERKKFTEYSEKEKALIEEIQEKEKIILRLKQ